MKRVIFSYYKDTYNDSTYNCDAPPTICVGHNVTVADT